MAASTPRLGEEAKGVQVPGRSDGARNSVVAFLALLGSPVARTPLAAQGKSATANGNRLAQFNGLTAGEWLAIMWQMDMGTSTQAGTNPLIKGGAVNRQNGVRVFGAPIMPAGSPTVTAELTVAPGTPLFVPIITVECSVAEAEPFHGEDDADLRTCANGNLDDVSNLAVAIDGEPVTDPYQFRVESPLFRFGPLPEDNFVGLPAGTQSDSVAAGFVMLLPPLSPGVHRIAVRADVTSFPVAVDAELVVTVAPPTKP